MKGACTRGTMLTPVESYLPTSNLDIRNPINQSEGADCDGIAAIAFTERISRPEEAAISILAAEALESSPIKRS